MSGGDVAVVRGSRYARLGPLGRALLPFYLGRPLPVVTPVSIYYDDGGQPPIFVLAGYGGLVDVLDHTLAPEWRALLASAPHPISEFKASDCRTGNGEFSEERGWTRDERDAFYRRAVAVIADACPQDDMLGYGAACIVRPVMPTERWRIKVLERIAYDACLSQLLVEVVTNAGRFVNQSDDGADVARLVYDEKRKFIALTNARFEIVRKRLGGLAAKVRWPIPEPSIGQPSLQAADLLAYETYKEVRSQLEDPVRAPSGALERLLASRWHVGYCVDFSNPYVWPLARRPPYSTTEVEPKYLYRSDMPLRGEDMWQPPNWPKIRLQED